MRTCRKIGSYMQTYASTIWFGTLLFNYSHENYSENMFSFVWASTVVFNGAYVHLYKFYNASIYCIRNNNGFVMKNKAHPHTRAHTLTHLEIVLLEYAMNKRKDNWFCIIYLRCHLVCLMNAFNLIWKRI